ncbi:MAG TPA: uridine kinase [Actinobacteria bacterium]|nr:uridine kinase [Actinomycetota bacterium]
MAEGASSPSWPVSATRPLVIAIAGGSGSGKTTIAERVVAAVGEDVAQLVPHDAYYRDQSHLPMEQRAAVNYDHPDALENELLVEHLVELRAGRSIERPVYDFAEHTRAAERVVVRPSPVLIVEGILVLAVGELRPLFDLRIYVDTDADLRLLRRLRRDTVERGRTVESVLDQYERTVRPMHLQFVEPSKRYADLIVPEGYNPNAVGTVTAMIRHHLAARGGGGLR